MHMEEEASPTWVGLPYTSTQKGGAPRKYRIIASFRIIFTSFRIVLGCVASNGDTLHEMYTDLLKICDCFNLKNQFPPNQIFIRGRHLHRPPYKSIPVYVDISKPKFLTA